MMARHFTSIALPEGWTREQDLQEFIYTFGGCAEIKCKTNWIREHLAESFESYEKTLDEALAYFTQPKDPTYVLFGRCFSLQEKIHRLKAFVASSGKDEYCVNRITETLEYYQWLSTEIPRVIDEKHRSDHEWLFPFGAASDHLVTAAMDLGEAMRIEYGANVR